MLSTQNRSHLTSHEYLYICILVVRLAICFLNLLEKPFPWACAEVICRTLLLNILDNVADSVLFIEFEVFLVHPRHLLQTP